MTSRASSRPGSSSSSSPLLRKPHDSTTKEPEFTLRAVVVGLLIGILLCFTNMYFGLQSGWISMMSLQASILGFAVFKVLPQSRLFSARPLTVHENIVLQTTAVATGTLPLAAGFVGIIPALSQLNPLQDNSPPLILSPLQLCLWSFSVAFFGVFLAVPLRRQVILKEKLVFPSGTATAQIISVLHHVPSKTNPNSTKRKGYRALNEDQDEEGDEDEESELIRDQADETISKDREGNDKIDQKGWTALMLSFSISAGFTLLSLAFPVVYAIPVFDVFGHLAHNWLWWFTPSFSYIGQGIIMGLPTTASMNLGMLVGWAFLSPLAKYQLWAPGPVSSSIEGSRGWILWPALAVMMAESVFSVMNVAVGQLSTALWRKRNPSTTRDDDDEEEEEEEVELKWMVIGVILSCLSCVLLVGIVFGQDGIKWWATIVALFLASIFSILGVRALGETDLNPVSSLSKISQLVFALIQPNNIVANLIAGGVTEAGAQQAGDLMQDLKTGHLHGASPKAQFQGQMIGSLASVFVSSGIYVLYRRVYELPSTNFPVPSAAIWLNLARLVNNGQLPPKSKESMIIFGFIFVVLSALKIIYRGKNWTKYIPSGIAFAIGFINTPSFSLARLIGGLISYKLSSKSGSHLENISLIIIASGFVLGEGFASVVGLATKSFGLGPVSCWGCMSGGGGYCGGC